MSNEKILIVDDEEGVRDMLKGYLEKEGYQTFEAVDGEEAIEKANSIKPDLIMLDVMLPKYDGFTVCGRIRKTMDCPIIMLTARSETTEKVVGLEVGADDYMTKPYELREISARIKANLRKHMKSDLAYSNNSDRIIKIRDLQIDTKNYVATTKKKVVDLTMKEFELLKLLASSPGEVFSRERILKLIWGYDACGDARTVDVAIRRLREKIEENTTTPKYILTKRGIGYYV